MSEDSVLELKDMKYSDAGDYLCVAMNDAGMKTERMTVRVEGTCDILFDKPHVSIYVDLTCTFVVSSTSH